MEKKKKLLSIVFLLVISIILISQFVLAENPVFDPIKDMFANWEQGQLSQNIAKYLFFILVVLLIWSILDVVQIPKSSTIRFLIGLVVSFLAVAYLTPNEIWLTLTSYSALGATLLFIVPFFILLFFTLRVAASGGATGALAQRAIWIIYFIFLVYRLVIGMYNGTIKTGESVTWIYIAAVLIAGLMVFANKWIVDWWGKEALEAESRAAETTLKKAVSMERLQAGGEEELAEGSKK